MSPKEAKLKMEIPGWDAGSELSFFEQIPTFQE